MTRPPATADTSANPRHPVQIPPGGSATVMDRLRVETRAAHEATEGIPFSAAMVQRRLPKDRFIAHLAAMAIVHEALEAALAASTHPTVRRVWRDDLRKLPLLRRDLAFFDATSLEGDAVAAPAGAYAAHIRALAAEKPVALLGHLYVLEGSTLGATILHGHIKEAYGLDQDGLAYYSPYGNAVMPHWREFKDRMNESAVDPAEQSQIVDGAKVAFARIGEILAAFSKGLPSR